MNDDGGKRREGGGGVSGEENATLKKGSKGLERERGGFCK